MKPPLILVLEDEPEVRQALVRDLECYSTAFLIESAENAEEAKEVLEESLGSGTMVALILCDHILPGQLGVDFLIELNRSDSTSATRKVLVTGQASHEDTVLALNDADLDRYISKPWTLEELKEVVTEQLTDYVIEEIANPSAFIEVLDGPRILGAMKGQNWPD